MFNPESLKKMCKRSEILERLLNRTNSAGVVFTNGCFDLLHYGHVQLLRKAKEHGGILVVGLNTDDSVRRLKGPLRPAIELVYRAAMLAEFPFVDLIVPFEEDTPLKLIETIMPAVIVKGSDYAVEEVIGATEIHRWGGQIVILPLVEDLSSTKLWDILQENPKSEQREGEGDENGSR